MVGSIALCSPVKYRCSFTLLGMTHSLVHCRIRGLLCHSIIDLVARQKMSSRGRVESTFSSRYINIILMSNHCHLSYIAN